MTLFCEFIRIQAELRGVFDAIYAAGRARLAGAAVRAAVLEVLS